MIAAVRAKLAKLRLDPPAHVRVGLTQRQFAAVQAVCLAGFGLAVNFKLIPLVDQGPWQQFVNALLILAGAFLVKGTAP